MNRFAFLALLSLPALAHANVVWPAAILTQGFYTWWVIAAGLVIEWMAIQRLFGLSVGRAAFVDLVANAASALLGVLLIPIAGFAYELFPGSLINWALSWGTFNPVAWLATVLLAALVNLVVEATIMKREFKLPLTRRTKWILYATNLVTVSLAIVAMPERMSFSGAG